jgi:hypothetical protein
MYTPQNTPVCVACQPGLSKRKPYRLMNEGGATSPSQCERSPSLGRGRKKTRPDPSGRLRAWNDTGENVKRAAFNLVVSVLLMATMAWGECISCSRLFSTGQTRSCCKPAGCEQPKPAGPGHADCRTHPESALAFVKSDAGWAQPADPAALFEVIDPPLSSARILPAAHGRELTRAPGHSPSELRLLLSMFRI